LSFLPADPRKERDFIPGEPLRMKIQNETRARADPTNSKASAGGRVLEDPRPCMMMDPSTPSTESFATMDSSSHCLGQEEVGDRSSRRRFNTVLNLDRFDWQNDHVSTNTITNNNNNDNDNKNNVRLVAVRYFLDRPGYDLHNSAVRLWFNPPGGPRCTCQQVRTFLVEHQIALPGLLVEVYLDQFGAYMMLDACESSNIEWDFSRTDARDNNPGILDIRLTDVVEDNNNNNKEPDATSNTGGVPKMSAWRALEQPQHHAEANHPPSPQLANVTPSGLFAFSMMVGLETTYLLESLVPGTVTDAFLLTWGPSMFFSGGLVQILVALVQVARNNVYGATVFFGFGGFWLSSGTLTILTTYSAPPGTCTVRARMMMMMMMVLLLSLTFLAHAILDFCNKPKERWRMIWSASPIPGATLSAPSSSLPFAVRCSSKRLP
jgi:succinate-acetate transporter protein